jgi:hypothetical protein
MMIIGCDYHPGFQQIAFFSRAFGWLAPPKSTRASEPALLWNQLHSEPPARARSGRSW